MLRTSFSLLLLPIILISACVSKPTENGYRDTGEQSPKLNQDKDEVTTKLIELDNGNISSLEKGLSNL